MKAQYILCLFLMLSLLPLALPANDSQSAPWWQAEFQMTVKGSYQFQGVNGPVNGEYSFNAQFQASLELDQSDDFMIYQGERKITHLFWKEKYPDSANPTPTERNLAGDLKPDVILNYALTQGSHLCFDFEMLFGPNTRFPAHWPPLLKNHLLLPRSALNNLLHKPDKYNKSIANGKNKICLSIKSLRKKPEVEETFQWNWNRGKKKIIHGHSVSLTAKIIRRGTTGK